MSEVFDFADPELWKSNSFAALRPRLITHLEMAVAQLNDARLYNARRMQTQPREHNWIEPRLAAIEARLVRAREILDVLRAR